ncbi:MAG: homoserine kinase, partial [Verrucomicrobiota bacterium]
MQEDSPASLPGASLWHSMISTDPSSARATIEVPGTTSNFGPGFDCLGAALSLTNRFCLELSEEGGETHAFLQEATDLFHAQPEVARSAPSFRWSVEGAVPRSRGLGSSVTVRLGILAAWNALWGEPLSRERLFALTSRLEGHPDNAGPAAFGGFFVGPPGGGIFTFPIPEALRFVTVVRRHEVVTDDARKVLPEHIPFEHAVANVGRVAGLVAAFSRGDLSALRGLFEDHLHEPYREVLNKGMRGMIRAGEEAGAYGGLLSGSCSTLICLTEADEADAVCEAMMAACPDEGQPEKHVLRGDNQGYRVAE